MYMGQNLMFMSDKNLWNEMGTSNTHDIPLLLFTVFLLLVSIKISLN